MKYATSRRLALIATALTFVVIILGAYTRLADAGLGCPDWPGCYGYLTVPKSQEAIDSTNTLYQERALEKGKAWLEMVHRYFAGALGLLIAAIAIIAWRQHGQNKHPVKLPSFILLLVTFQAALGMWTVTMKLHPSIVMLHLLGGFSTFALLFLLSMRLSKPGKPFRIKKALAENLKPWALAGLVLVILQIALGGWTSANYASQICNGVVSLPICQGDWTTNLNFREALTFWGFEMPDKGNFEFGHFAPDVRITIHIMHRIGALVVTAYLLWLAWRLRNSENELLSDLSNLMLIILTVQILLGLGNVLLGLPLLVATAHNAVAALLMLNLVAINYVIRVKQRTPYRRRRRPNGR